MQMGEYVGFLQDLYQKNRLNAIINYFSLTDAKRPIAYLHYSGNQKLNVIIKGTQLEIGDDYVGNKEYMLTKVEIDQLFWYWVCENEDGFTQLLREIIETFDRGYLKQLEATNVTFNK